MNSDLAYSSLGPCEDYEFDLVELIDGTLAPERASAVRRHLQSCARCRAFAARIRDVDTSLVDALPRVQLSGDFDARLRDRIGQLARAVPRESMRAAAETEYRSILRTLRRGMVLRSALNVAVAGALGAGAAVALKSTAPALLQAYELWQPMVSYVTALAVACGLAAPFILRRSTALFD